MDKRDLIKGIKEVLGDIDFKPLSVGAGSVSLVNNNSEIVFSYRKYPDTYILGTQIIGYKYFPEVEEILKPLYKKHNIGYVQYTIYKQSRSIEEMFNIKIASINDISKISEYLRLLVFGDILPFFEEYQNVSQVMDKIESLPKEEISKFLHLPQLPRIMILKRINENNDWKEYCKWATDIYNTMATGPNGSQHKSVNNLVIDLNEYLFNMSIRKDT